MITGSQIRAARALLGWSAVELSRRAEVSYATVQRGEQAEDTPNMQGKNLARIKNALEAGGVEFLDDRHGGFGVRTR